MLDNHLPYTDETQTEPKEKKHILQEDVAVEPMPETEQNEQADIHGKKKPQKPKKQFFLGMFCGFGIILLFFVLYFCLTEIAKSNKITTPIPKADILSFDILVNQKLDKEDFVKNINEFEEYKIEIIGNTDFCESGKYTVCIAVFDDRNNFEKYNSTVIVHDVNTEISAEYGSSQKEIFEKIFNDEFSKSCLKLKNRPSLLGENKTELVGKYNTIPITINLIDTTPPEISGVKNLFIFRDNDTPPPDYLQNITAKDKVSGKVDVTVDTSSINLEKGCKYSITYSATDSSGNTATENAYVTVIHDSGFMLNVENIMQTPELPNGCEAVSLAIALKYAGYDINPVLLYNTYMPKSSYKSGDPWTTYVGDATGTGLGCYAPCVVSTGNSYLSEQNSDMSVVDVSGYNINEYIEYIDNRTPVIVWGLLEMCCDGGYAWQAYINGKYVTWRSYSHCLVLIGYTSSNFIFCDPLEGIVEYDRTMVEESFDINHRQACIIQ